jgi:hypothetical protein
MVQEEVDSNGNTHRNPRISLNSQFYFHMLPSKPLLDIQYLRENEAARKEYLSQFTNKDQRYRANRQIMRGNEPGKNGPPYYLNKLEDAVLAAYLTKQENRRVHFDLVGVGKIV